MSKRILLIYNKKAGRGAVKSCLAELIDIFSDAGYNILIYPTKYSRDIPVKIGELKNEIDAVACAGGDGTLSGAISGIVENGGEIPLFYIPAGSTNDLAVSLGISKNIIQAAKDALRGEVRRIDVGRFNDKYFSYVAAFGYLTDISYSTDQDMKNKFGYMAYMLNFTKGMFKLPVIEMTIKIEDKDYSGRWFYGMITNSKQVAGIKNITGSDIEFSDGKFEVTLIRETSNPIEFVEVINAVANGTPSRFVLRAKASKIEIHCENEVSWTLDGEDGGKYTDVVIENINKALPILLCGEK